MSYNFIKFNNVSFTYEGMSSLLFEGLTFQIQEGWTGIIGPNGSGKSTLLKLSTGNLKCSIGFIETSGNTYYAEQRTDYPPAEFFEMLKKRDKHFYRLIEQMEIDAGWIERWGSLSHGERKRIQIAAALWNDSGIVALDEPTNHLDIRTKDLILNSLLAFKGTGLIVSHDRDLLNRLCIKYIFTEPPRIDIRKGDLDDVMEQRKTENDYLIKSARNKQAEIRKLEAEYKRRQENEEKAKNKYSKKNLDPKDRDAKGRIDLARLTGKDAVWGNLKTAMSARIDKANSELNGIEFKKEFRKGITLSSSRSNRNFLLNEEAGCLKLSDKKILNFPQLVIKPDSRISLIGANGSGKSTLVNYLLGKLNAELEHITYIPQEITANESSVLIQEVKKMNSKDFGKLMIVMSRLGSDPKKVIESDSPSPGETRKLMLGLGIAKEPHIIILDEPTNHMDLISIECLEEALQNVNCALLLVSHDTIFLEKLTTERWEIKEIGNELVLNLE